jgi:hypothetical protein
MIEILQYGKRRVIVESEAAAHAWIERVTGFTVGHAILRWGFTLRPIEPPSNSDARF